MSKLSIHLYLVSESLAWTFLSWNRILFTLPRLISSFFWKKPAWTLHGILWLIILLRALGQHLPCDLTGVSADPVVLCCTSSLVWNNSSCLWNLHASITYKFCNHCSFKFINGFSFQIKISLNYHYLLHSALNCSLPSLAYLILGFSFLLWRLSYLETCNLGLGIYKIPIFTYC